MTRVIILLLGGSLVAGGIGAIWLFGIGPAVGMAAPTSPGLAVTVFIAAGLIAGFMVYLQLRHLFPHSIDRRDREKCIDPEKSNLKTIGAIVDHLDHKLNNSLMIIRGQAEVFFRRDQDGPDSQGFKNIMDQADLISEELKALSDLKKIETEAYFGEHLMLKVPRKKTDSKETT